MSIPKFAFNPCLFRSDVYLVELCEYQGAEKFNKDTEIYTSILVALPYQFGWCFSGPINALYYEGAGSVEVEHRDWSNFYIKICMRFGTDEHSVQLSPVHRRNCVYFIEYTGGQLHTFNLVSSSLSECC